MRAMTGFHNHIKLHNQLKQTARQDKTGKDILRNTFTYKLYSKTE